MFASGRLCAGVGVWLWIRVWVWGWMGSPSVLGKHGSGMLSSPFGEADSVGVDVAMPPSRRVLGIPLRASVIRTIAVFVSFPVVVRKLKIQNHKTREVEEKEKNERETKERERSLRHELEALQRKLEEEQKKQESLRLKMVDLQQDMMKNKDKVNREDYEKLEAEAQALKARVDRLHEVHAARRSASSQKEREEAEGVEVHTTDDDRRPIIDTLSKKQSAGTSPRDEVEPVHHPTDAKANRSDQGKALKVDAEAPPSPTANGSDKDEAKTPADEKGRGRRGLWGRVFSCAACTPVRGGE
eukprot:scaffold798_cov367-Pavlova_lutheri.AAC.22